MYLDLIQLEKEVQDGYVNKQKHPDFDLWLYNYSRKSQWEWKWSDISLKCRGLVLDAAGSVVFMCLRKFFSYEQLLAMQDYDFAKNILHKITNQEEFEVFDKVDGSLLLVGKYQDQIIFATRGSFNSEQVAKAKEIWKSKYQDYNLLDNHTYHFEIVYPQNRIVLDYGDLEDIFLLAVVNNKTGEELDIYTLDVPFRKASKYNITSFDQLVSYAEPDSEGVVIKFKDNSRIKIKTAQYKALHKILTGVSNKAIWECLSENKPLDQWLEGVPDEFDGWVRSTALGLENKYSELEADALIYFSLRPKTDDRKTLALYFQQYKFPSILFSMLDGRDYSAFIWKQIKPKFEKAFRTDEE